MVNFDIIMNVLIRKYPHYVLNKPAEFIWEGSANDVVLIDKDGDNPRVFRFPKAGHQEARQQIRLEQKLMPLLKSWAPHIPQYDIMEKEPTPFVSYPMIKGIQLLPQLYPLLNKEQLDDVAKNIAHVLYGIHAFPGNPYFPPAQSTLEHYKYRWGEHYKAVQHDVFPLLDDHQRKWVAGLYEFFNHHEVVFQPCFINGDMKRDHILIDPVTFRFKGIIDLGLCMGDPAMDFGYIRLGEEFLNQVLSHYKGPMDSTFRKRARFYQYTVPLTGLLVGVRDQDKAYIKISLRLLEEAMQNRNYF